MVQSNAGSVGFVAAVAVLLVFILMGEGARAILEDADQVVSLMESERLAEYHKRNFTWPRDDFIPNTLGWKAHMQERLGQIEEMTDTAQRYEAYVQTMNPAFVVPNFTEYGFGLARAPEELTEALRQGIRDGLPTAEYEHEVDIITPRAKVIRRPDLTDRVLNELINFPEEWSGVDLEAHLAYGFRLYQNGSELLMHVDRPQTHIVSFIYHIDSSDDAEPWPIFIEDFHGNTHEVILTPGDILFYESSKCMHGRPKPLNGSWYTSVFVHYFPKEGWMEMDHATEPHYYIPPHWNVDPDPDAPRFYNKMEMVLGGMLEPDCPYHWCRTRKTIKWSGPAEEGYWIGPDMQRHPFHPKLVEPVVQPDATPNDEL